MTAPLIADTGGLLRALARTAHGTASFPEFETVLTSASHVIVPALVLAEIDYFLREEWARTADDVLWRRTKCGLAMRDADRVADGHFEDAEREQPLGVIVQLGGQTPLKLAKGLAAAGVPIWGTSPDAIDHAEDRKRFGALLEEEVTSLLSEWLMKKEAREEGKPLKGLKS